MPVLSGAQGESAEAIGDAAVVARWRMKDDSLLTIAINLGDEMVPADLPTTTPLFAAGPDDRTGLPPASCRVWLA